MSALLLLVVLVVEVAGRARSGVGVGTPPVAAIESAPLRCASVLMSSTRPAGCTRLLLLLVVVLVVLLLLPVAVDAAEAEVALVVGVAEPCAA